MPSRTATKKPSPHQSSTDFPTKKLVTIKTRTTRTKTIYTVPVTKPPSSTSKTSRSRPEATMSPTLKINTNLLPGDNKPPPTKPDSPIYIPPPVDSDDKPPPTKPDSPIYNPPPIEALPAPKVEHKTKNAIRPSGGCSKLPLPDPMKGWTVEKEHAKVGGPWHLGARVNPEFDSMLRKMKK